MVYWPVPMVAHYVMVMYIMMAYMMTVRTRRQRWMWRR